MDKSNLKLKVKIFSPYRTYYEGAAVSLSAVNKVGPFDVLPKHVNFLSLLSPCSVAVNTGFSVYQFPISSGILKVADDSVTLFADL